jgi:hypothetical protein
MKLQCPACRRDVPAIQCNVAADVAVCANCNESFAISAQVARFGDGIPVDVAAPPSGAWFHDDGFGTWEVGATTRSWIALYLVPFMMVWSGFSLGGIYGTQFSEGKFDLFRSLFGIPFLLGTLLFGSLALMAVCGKVRLRVHNDEADLLVGIAGIGWRKSFTWSTVTSIEERVSLTQYPGGRGAHLVLDGPQRMSFAGMLSEPRRTFVLRVLRERIAASSPRG